MPPSITVKGIPKGLLIILPDNPWEDVEAALLEKLDQESSFFEGAQVTLQIGARALRAAELGQLRDKFADREVALCAVLSESGTTKRAAQTLGLETSLPKPPPPPIPEIAVEGARRKAVLVQQTLRSGRSIDCDGHVVIIGDVNPGAEVVAGGNVVVWGRLSGVVHAGARGHNEAVVCALNLSPTQLRIGSLITTSPKRHGKPEPEMAHIRDGKIVAERWISKETKRRRR